MEIAFSYSKNIDVNQLLKLFSSVNWESGKYPEKLSRAISKHSFVCTAWINESLIGLISVMDDGELNAAITYLLVDPLYQKIGIGRRLINNMKKNYCRFLNVSLISYKDVMSFYEMLDFKSEDDTVALFL